MLVDDQDTNTLQNEIINRFASHHRLMAVGDDAQCIYTWRGAKFPNIMSFSDEHPNTNIYKIETNYRSSPEIFNFANRILDAQPAGLGYKKTLKPIKPSSSKPYFIPLIDGVHQAHFILHRIQGLL